MEAEEGASLSLPRSDGPAAEEEPRLRYGPLIDDSSRPATADPAATRLAVSDKVLAVGHQGGQVHLLSHQGDQVRPITSRGEMDAPLGTANPGRHCRRRRRRDPRGCTSLGACPGARLPRAFGGGHRPVL